MIEDEQGKKEEAINVFKKLIFQDKVLMVFGPTLSNSALRPPTRSPGREGRGVRHLQHRRRHHRRSATIVFRDSVTEADVVPDTVKAAVKHSASRRSPCMYGNDDAFTKSGYDVFKKALDEQKIPVTDTETFAKGDIDFKAQLTKIKAINPDAIVCPALAEEAAQHHGAGPRSWA